MTLRQSTTNANANSWWTPLLTVALVSVWAPLLWSLIAAGIGGPEFGQLLQDWDYGIAWLWWPLSYAGGLVFTTAAWLLWRAVNKWAMLAGGLSVLTLLPVLVFSTIGIYGFACFGCSEHTAHQSTEAARWIAPMVAGTSLPMWLHLTGVLIVRRLRQ